MEYCNGYKSGDFVKRRIVSDAATQAVKEIIKNKIQQINHRSLKVFEQKLDYIHNNPVETGFVTDPIDWKYSSARNNGNNDQTVYKQT